jgi:hypothetical protein
MIVAYLACVNTRYGTLFQGRERARWGRLLRAVWAPQHFYTGVSIKEGAVRHAGTAAIYLGHVYELLVNLIVCRQIVRDASPARVNAD